MPSDPTHDGVSAAGTLKMLSQRESRLSPKPNSIFGRWGLHKGIKTCGCAGSYPVNKARG